MSTGQTHVADMEIIRFAVHTSFNSIDQEIRALDMETIIAASTLPVAEDRLVRLLTIYKAVRPLLRAFAVLPLIPEHWRNALQLLIATLDEIAAATPEPDFKAGKDL